jgi:hypothetical protein
MIDRDLLTKVGQLEHRVQAIKLALSATALADGVRAALVQNLRVAEEALQFARERAIVEAEAVPGAHPAE